MKLMKCSKVLFSLLLVVAVAMTSCSKEKIKGCTDSDSVNYNSEAEEDDGTCKYEGEGVIYFDQAQSDFLATENITMVFYYIDGNLVGEASATDFFVGVPNCGAQNTVTFKSSLTAKSKVVSFVVKAENSMFTFESEPVSYTITANNCTKINADLE